MWKSCFLAFPKDCGKLVEFSKQCKRLINRPLLNSQSCRVPSLLVFLLVDIQDIDGQVHGEKCLQLLLILGNR